MSHIFSVLSFLEILEAFFFTLICGQLSSKPSREEKTTKVIGQTVSFLLDVSNLSCPKGAFRLGCVISDRHRCVTGKPLTSASRSADCCRFSVPVRDMMGLLPRQTPDLLTMTVACHQGGT